MCQGCHGWIGFQGAIGQLSKASESMKGVEKVPKNKKIIEAGEALGKAADGFAQFYHGQTGKDWKKPYFS